MLLSCHGKTSVNYDHPNMTATHDPPSSFVTYPHNHPLTASPSTSASSSTPARLLPCAGGEDAFPFLPFPPLPFIAHDCWLWNK